MHLAHEICMYMALAESAYNPFCYSIPSIPLFQSSDSSILYHNTHDCDYLMPCMVVLFSLLEFASITDRQLIFEGSEISEGSQYIKYGGSEDCGCSHGYSWLHICSQWHMLSLSVYYSLCRWYWVWSLQLLCN